VFYAATRGKFVCFPLKNLFQLIKLQKIGMLFLGTALGDSPAGLAAYILEKFSTGTNMSHRSLPDGGLTNKFTLETLLDNVMIYWVTSSITTSQRLYSEFYTFKQLRLRLEE